MKIIQKISPHISPYLFNLGNFKNLTNDLRMKQKLIG